MKYKIIEEIEDLRRVNVDIHNDNQKKRREVKKLKQHINEKLTEELNGKGS